MLYNDDTFERGGRTFTVEFWHDECMGPPWKEIDGHGPVREERASRGNGKRSGERVLHKDGDYLWLYDWQEATRIAKRDGWGISREDRIAFAWKHWRCPTNKEVVRMAVQRDFDYLRRWCNDEWHWQTVVVRCDDELHGKIDRSLGGVASDDPDLVDFAHELADEINDDLDALDEELRKGMVE